MVTSQCTLQQDKFLWNPLHITAKAVKDWNNLQNKAVFKFNQEQVYTPKLISTLKKNFLTSSVTSLLQIKHFVFLSYFFCLQNIAS